MNHAEQPSSLEAESSLLSCLFDDSRRVPELLLKAPPVTFYHLQTQTVYTVIQRLHDRFQPVNVVSVTSYLRDNGKLESVGGAAAISAFYTDFVPVQSQFQNFANLVLEKHAQRQIVDALAEILQQVRQPEAQSANVIECAIAVFQKLAESRVNDSDLLPGRTLDAILQSVIDHADERAKSTGRIPGLSTGLAAIDEHTGGQQPGRLWVIAGETSDGKSCLVQNFVEAALDAGAHAAIYSFEMPEEELGIRLLCSRSEVSSSTINNGLLTREHCERIQRAMGQLRGSPLIVRDVADATIEDICRDIDRRVSTLRKSDPKAQFVAAIDYLQLANTFRNFDNRERAVAHISKTAKQTAKRNKITILMPSQLNDDGKLRESRAISHDADVLLLIRKPKGAKKDDMSNDREIFCPKNRGGRRNWYANVILRGEHFKFVHREVKQ